ncbi:ATP-binding protein [Bacillus alkalicellulosilyticus]|uniref:ATP-binding protein n=1 Tax=Alkalihalobacterium alkalicellulosilyticum TaxID=1912214 RepID=UPI000997D601|nr:ATP-binding protein [Bacillus alkalicellulosilyticus]
MLEIKAKEKILYHLEKIQTHILAMWQEKAIVRDGNHEELYVQGQKIFGLITSFINRPCDNLIKSLALEVAYKEGLTHVDEFVYNMNLYRRYLLDSLEQIDINPEERKPLLHHINYCIDEFMYLSISTFSDIASKDYEDRQFIAEESHKDRLTLLGQMSSSFVHEFRNPLTSVMGFVKLLKNESSDSRYLDIITHELEQLNFRISQFLLASKRETSLIQREETFQLKKLFDEILEFLYPSIVDGDVNITTTIDENVELHGYRDEIRQVYINLIMNAIDALQMIEGQRILHVKVVQDKNVIAVSVSNNGPAIPERVMQTIFKPFFTTKKLGTGIGLYISRKIIEKHNGTITCESNEEQTVFTTTFIE